MSYEEYINNTFPNDIFDIIKCREYRSCCYNSFLTSRHLSRFLCRIYNQN